MKLAMIGLGRMGGNMVRRLMRDGHECVVYARHAETVREFEQLGATGATSLADVVAKLAPPRILWVMLPSGEPTATAISELAALASPGDVIIDGGNSFWKDDVAHARALAEKGIRYVDVGVSGGVWGLERGYCLMIGGPTEAVELLDPIFATLAPGAGKIGRTPGRDGALSRPERGYVHVGPSGSGHFVKMVHNGIEYGMMQAYAEGFDLLRSANTEARPEDERFTLNTAEIAEVWRRGSVVSSWLLDLTAQALAADGDLQRYSGVVSDSGEGRWTINAAIEQATPVNVLAAALFERFRSRQEHSFADKLLSAMREGFGGHKEASSGS